VSDLSDDERKVLRDSLLAWKNDGHAKPVMPVYEDLDNDGIPDFYGLDANNELVVVSGTVQDSVAESTGDGFETGGAA
jgi:hypothetical protein